MKDKDKYGDKNHYGDYADYLKDLCCHCMYPALNQPIRTVSNIYEKSLKHKRTAVVDKIPVKRSGSGAKIRDLRPTPN